MKEQLNKTIHKLAEKLKAAEEAKSYSTTVIYQTEPEKSLRKFREGVDIDNWLETIRSYISLLKKESEKVDMIMNFLDHAPYTEVRFRIDRSKATSSEVLDILKKTTESWRVSWWLIPVSDPDDPEDGEA